MTLSIETIDGPAFLACALINGDESGMSDDDILTLEMFLSTIPAGYVVCDVSENNYMGVWHKDGLMHELAEYTIINT